ncbi:AFG1-like ATPase [bacterium BMS3Bbin10]|nr:AFG1-like ATPase [bacterium BMS3Bbin10]
MENGPLQSYRSMVADGHIRPDPAQLLAAGKLELLANRLAQYDAPAKSDFFSFFGGKRGEVPEGLYMFGGVGRGKTMLMDLFFEDVPFAPKRRVHFHEFMAEVHELIARFRSLHEGDPIPATAQAIVSEARLLCFDELHVTDIADAMILGRLFKGLFEAGLVMVATSNLQPGELYKDGLNRPLFEPFIEILEDRMDVLQLEAAADYRLEKLQGAQLYFTPAGKKSAKAMRETFTRLTGYKKGRPATLKVKSREIAIPETAMGVALFDFDDLCGQPLGAHDYLVIAHAYHILMIENVPVMKPEHRNQARRFVNLIDTLYDAGVRLVLSAQAQPDALYAIGDGAELFERTASRLIEMRSKDYLARARPGAAPDGAG